MFMLHEQSIVPTGSNFEPIEMRNKGAPPVGDFLHSIKEMQRKMLWEVGAFIWSSRQTKTDRQTRNTKLIASSHLRIDAFSFCFPRNFILFLPRARAGACLVLFRVTRG